jgi:glycosyltransferase involved in cell wall biosynthesis
MKIGVDARVLLDKNYSGVAGFTYNLLKKMLEVDKRNAYCFFYNSFRDFNTCDFESDNVRSIKTRIPNKIFNYVCQKIFSYPKLDKITGDSDIFYMPHINFASFSGKGKKIITIHDLSFLRYPEFFSWRKNFWHNSVNISKNINKFDKIIAVSNNTKNDLIDILSVPEEKINVIYSGLFNDSVSDTDFSSENNYLEKNYNIKDDYILYLGTIEPRKNILGIIKAYEMLRDKGVKTLLVLAGGWGWKTKEIKRAWKNSRYRNDIRFIGYVEEKTKPLLYKKASVFLYPSFYEGFGFPPLEAMFFGTPVVASNVSSLPEILQDCALLINPSRPGEICDAIDIILKNDFVKNSLVNSGRKRSLDFSWEKTAIKYLDVFNEVYKA